ncbi:hypothetical protein M0C34_08765 [Agarivorans sp. TSD2052]|uniref:hypothetical protein n=1 Tax=Agarivorans sp. TSD2052 TaxID=2937286 RepID=UPI00200FB6D7|nr:hypothetical protein [Agarivorans sp. TSD2052]UPW20336.1 hypothetical protein M0C34_08765 [Agarivorans sp. TSD2052]
MFKKAVLYLEVRQGSIKATELNSGKTLTHSSDAFAHPRSLIGDFFAVERCFTSIVNDLAPKTFLSGPTTIVVHLLENAEGGFTNVEVRAFKEAALSAGGQVVSFPSSEALLTKEQLITGAFAQLDSI